MKCGTTIYSLIRMGLYWSSSSVVLVLFWCTESVEMIIQLSRRSFSRHVLLRDSAEGSPGMDAGMYVRFCQ